MVRVVTSSAWRARARAWARARARARAWAWAWAWASAQGPGWRRGLRARGWSGEPPCLELPPGPRVEPPGQAHVAHLEADLGERVLRVLLKLLPKARFLFVRRRLRRGVRRLRVRRRGRRRRCKRLRRQPLLGRRGKGRELDIEELVAAFVVLGGARGARREARDAGLEAVAYAHRCGCRHLECEMVVGTLLTATLCVQLRTLGIGVGVGRLLIPRPPLAREPRRLGLQMSRRLERQPEGATGLVVQAVVPAVARPKRPASIATPRAQRELAAALHLAGHRLCTASVRSAWRERRGQRERSSQPSARRQVSNLADRLTRTTIIKMGRRLGRLCPRGSQATRSCIQPREPRAQTSAQPCCAPSSSSWAS